MIQKDASMIREIAAAMIMGSALSLLLLVILTKSSSYKATSCGVVLGFVAAVYLLSSLSSSLIMQKGFVPSDARASVRKNLSKIN